MCPHYLGAVRPSRACTQHVPSPVIVLINKSACRVHVNLSSLLSPASININKVQLVAHFRLPGTSFDLHVITLSLSLRAEYSVHSVQFTLAHTHRAHARGLCFWFLFSITQISFSLPSCSCIYIFKLISECVCDITIGCVFRGPSLLSCSSSSSPLCSSPKVNVFPLRVCSCHIFCLRLSLPHPQQI